MLTPWETLDVCPTLRWRDEIWCLDEGDKGLLLHLFLGHLDLDTILKELEGHGDVGVAT